MATLENFAHKEIDTKVPKSSMKNSTRNLKGLGRKTSVMLFATVLLSSIAISAHEAHAMGQAPSTCQNRYDGEITAMKIKVGEKIYDPIANPNLTFRLSEAKSYTVVLTIHTASTSSQGNTLTGSTWLDTNAVGYQLGQCINSVTPNQEVKLTKTESHPANLEPGTEQTVTWNTLSQASVTYNVKWTSP